jgi:membrane peptidoglycan carboxypeptidase
MTTEDGAFSHHRGFNRPAIRASIVSNLKARRFVRGASTITMQLAKNLFLSRDKTLARKLQEVVLTDYLEQAFTKDEIMELYLNVIEFGPAVYGVTSAAEYYFGRSPSDLNLAEGLFLSSLLPAPLRYGSMRDLAQAPEGWMRTLRSLMHIANKRGLVTDAELAEGEGEAITFWHGGTRPPPRVVTHLRSRLEGNEDDGEDPPAMPPDGP